MAGAAAALVLGATLLTGCGGGGSNGGGSSAQGDGPRGVAGAYLSAWDHDDYAAMARLVSHPPATFASFHRHLVASLGVEDGRHQLGRVVQHGDRATAALTNRFTLAGLGTWAAHGTLTLVDRSGSWLVAWSPRTIDRALGTDDHLRLDLEWPDRAPILGAGGAPLTSSVPMVRVGLEGSRVTDAAALTTGLEQAGIAAADITSALGTATAHPQWFVPLTTLTEDRYAAVKPIIYPLPGTVFETVTSRQAITPDLAAHVVGSVGPITAEQLKELGAPYDASDVVGRSGIEQAYEHQLAGRPGGTIEVVDGAGHTTATIGTFTPQPGTPVRTTIDPTVEAAAEQALDGVAQPAALVAVRASSGDVLASVSRPVDQALDQALVGRYPPGSTFKVVTSADLLEHGLTPSSPATCPPTIAAGGRTFHNFEGESAASLTFEQAFAQSCNSAFIGLSADLPDASFPSTASQFGLGATPHLGLDAFGGSVPAPESDADRAATAIGQGKVLVSPLSMGVVAATVASGVLHPPRLVIGASGASGGGGASGASDASDASDGDSAAPAGMAAPAGTALDPSVVAALQQMMADVVASGTAAGAGLPAGTHGKTGTAEYGTADPPQTHAWFIGYRGDVAFAVLVVGGGVGGAVAAPIAAKFLGALGS